MNDRLVTAGGALVALLFVYGLFFASGGEIPATPPLSNEPGRNGYLALARWLESGDIPVVSWRERFDDLLDSDRLSEPTGNIMLMTLPGKRAYRDSEMQQLIGWVRRGNTLLIMAALNDSPDWTANLPPDGSTLLPPLSALTGLRFQALPMQDPESGAMLRDNMTPAGSRVILEPLAHPLMQQVDRLEGYSDLDASKWRVTNTAVPYSERPLPRLARDRQAGTDAAWELPAGAGRILLFASGSLFANESIAATDARFLLANLLGFHRAPRGAFIFDDMHQGLSALYDPDAFFADSRLHRTIAFLVAAWLVYLLSASNRIAPVRPDRGEARQSDLIGGIGGFMARRLDPRETGLMIFEDWFRELRMHRGLSASAGPPWASLAATPALRRSLLARLQDDYARLTDGQRVDLVSLHNRIRQARRAIG